MSDDEHARRAPFIAIAGNIATGKSGLLGPLADALGLTAWPERWDENPWFGRQPPLPLAAQLWFLAAAAADNTEIMRRGGVQERCIHEHALVFAEEQLQGDEVRLARDLYLTLDELLAPPDLIVFLDASPATLLRRIQERGRPEEMGLDVEYLSRLDLRYRQWLDRWTICPVLTVDTEQTDLRAAESAAGVAELVKERLR